MGALAAWGVAEGDWASVWQAVIVDLFSGGAAWGDSPCAEAAFPAGIDACGAEEILRGIPGARSMRSIARARPRAVDGKPGDQARRGRVVRKQRSRVEKFRHQRLEDIEAFDLRHMTAILDDFDS